MKNKKEFKKPDNANGIIAGILASGFMMYSQMEGTIEIKVLAAIGWTAFGLTLMGAYYSFKEKSGAKHG